MNSASVSEVQNKGRDRSYGVIYYKTHREKFKEYGARYYAKNRAKILAKQAQRRATNPEHVRLIALKTRAKNIEKRRAGGRRYYAENKARAIAARADWASRNPDKVKTYRQRYRAQSEKREKERAYTRSWRAANLEYDRVTNKKWRDENKAKLAAIQSMHRARVLRATPMWADRSAIEQFYERARNLSAETGCAWHVDHIVPLKSKRVCGLHCENNLRVIPGVENVSKGNRHWPDMP